jgi:hypothetical protein
MAQAGLSDGGSHPYEEGRKKTDLGESGTKQPNRYMAILCIMRFGGRVKWSQKKSVDETFWQKP